MRLRVPDEGATVVHDAIRGDTRFEHVHLDDPVIARADGSVLYNFAVAIDDLDAGITHVVRGEDHLSNTPKQLLVLEAARAVGLRRRDAPLPVYAHLPLLHGPDGKKLSKRHGAASVQELRDAGYLPEAVRNYLALLGWGAGDDATVLSTAELVERFTLERVSRNPARFDEVKLRWLNGVYIRELPVAELTARSRGSSRAVTRTPPMSRGSRARVAISQEKIQTLADFWPLAGSLLDGPVDDPAARERWLGRGRDARRSREARAALAGAAEASTRPASAPRWRRVVARAPAQAARGLPAAARGDLPGRRSRRASSRASRCSAARRRCARIDRALVPAERLRELQRSLNHSSARLPIGPHREQPAMESAIPRTGMRTHAGNSRTSQSATRPTDRSASQARAATARARSAAHGVARRRQPPASATRTRATAGA